MIKIADYTEKLDRLNALDREQDAQNEFDQICMKLFDATLNDISDDDFYRIEDLFGDLHHLLTVEFCRSAGYDMIIRDRVPVSDWEDFAIMIVAKTMGMLPKDAEDRAHRRLEAEARDFLDEERTLRG